jgi:hypothetical protein
MSRYRVEETSAVSTTRNIYGPGGLTLGYIYGPWKPEAERFKRFIEAHDEIVAVLRQIAEANGKWLVLEACADNLTSIINRIDGEEAE